MKISIIVAVSENNVIGKRGQLPWHSSEDLKHFKSLTTGHHILMGRKTHESIGRPLPGRTNIILARDEKFKPEGCFVFQELGEAIRFAKDKKEKELFIIGGEQIYRFTLPLAERIYLTEVKKNFDGDAYFPEINEEKWNELSREEHLDLQPPIIFRTLERR
ncbi:MAG: dihydrofolate reductase [Patescibacteria group bacterium]